MNNKTLLALWGGLYILCGALGFVPEPTGALRILLILCCAAFFLPPLMLIRQGNRDVLQLIRTLALIWLILTTVLIILNFLSLGASVRLGNTLYCLLILVSSPMICGQSWVISLFGWSWLLFSSRQGLKKR